MHNVVWSNKQASSITASCHATEQIKYTTSPESCRGRGGEVLIHQVGVLEEINNTLPLITNKGFLQPPTAFLHPNESHSYKTFLPQFSRSLLPIRETCHIHFCSSPNPQVLIFSEAEVVGTAQKFSNMNQITQLLHLISPA